MSWQSYIDDQLLSTGKIKQAVICGHDGNIWASSQGFGVTAAELQSIVTNLDNAEKLGMNGVVVAGTKYMFLSSTEKVLRAKKLSAGLHAIKTVQGMILCLYDEPVKAEEAAVVTERLGDYLISVGY